MKVFAFFSGRGPNRQSPEKGWHHKARLRGCAVAFTATHDPSADPTLRAAAPVYLAAVREHYLAHLTGDEVRVLAGALGKVVRAEEA